MSRIPRIIDANANRAREALRVMEEAARFLLDDDELTRALKELRHDLARALSACPDADLSRDTPGDVGTGIATAGEATRTSTFDVVVAAGKRLGESLRALEEYGKVEQADFAAVIEQLRYRGYDLEHRLCRALGSGRRRQWKLCVLLTEALCARPWQEVARRAFEHGADCIQLREKHLTDTELLERARTLVSLRPQGASVVINDRPDIALLAGADGVHLGQDDLPCAAVRRLAGRCLLIGVSTSKLDEARQALRDGADSCGVGPMFTSTTKRKDVIVGPAYLRAYLEWDRLPHLAIGGVTPENIDVLVEAGVRGVAVSAAVCGADDPGAVVSRLLRALAPEPQPAG